MGLKLAVIPVGFIELELTTFIVTEAHAVTLQGPSALTKYVVVDKGLTFNELPVPSYVPPQLPEYHFQLAPPVPNEPPETDNVVGIPGQLIEFPVAPVGADEFVLLTVTVIETQDVVLQVPSALTK